MPLVDPVTVRIPELPPQLEDLTLSDYLAGWDASQNKTLKFSLEQVRSLVLTGGPTALVPVVVAGGNVYGRVEASDAETDSVLRPDLAGKTFDLELEGNPMIPQTDPPNALAEFEVLAGGGFKLINGDVVHLDQKYKLEIHGSTVGGGSGSTGAASLFTGRKEVTTNYSLDVVTGGEDLNKLVQIRSGATQVVITLPSVLDIPANLPIVFEAMIGTSVENKITTTGGQFFYLNNTSKTSLYIRPGEVVWLFRYSDGFYVINDFGDKYKKLAKPIAAFTADTDLNEVVLKGQLVLRADYPRLWEKVQTLGNSLVSEAVWSLASGVNGAGQTVEFPNRGKWSTGDTSTTFRFPDFRGMALRGVIAETGSDNERYTNDRGNYQKNELKSHGHDVFTTGNEVTSDPGRALQRDDTDGDGYTPGAGSQPYIEVTGGAETRMDNIGILWVTNV